MMRDQPDRDLIVSALDDTLVVEAAAGTGKTTELVRRIVRIIETGRAKHVREIVAVTFTEKAAGELKLRLREAFEDARQRAAGPEPGGRSLEPGARSLEPVRERLDSALATLEEAQVSTIHGFCADLLRERPVEAGVDPLFTVLADAQAARLFDQEFSVWLQEQLAGPPEGIRRSLRRPSFGGFMADAEDGPLERLRRAAWELVEWRDFDGAWQRDAFDRKRRVDALVEAVHAFAAVSAQASSHYDTLYQDTLPARRLSEEIRRTEQVAPRDYDRLEAALIELGRHRDMRRARKGRTRDYGKGVVREDVWQARERLLRALDEFEMDANADLAALLQQELRGAVARYQDTKARAGALDFLDLLLCARDLIRDRADVRRHFQERFKYIFVDEFQDTDPLQAEILLLLAADDPTVTDWRQVRPLPGKLFIVGDPKQSIYRFRRADVGIYRRVCEQLLASGARSVTLGTSFRARPNIQRTVNAAFAPVMTGDEATLQANYVPLEPFRDDPADQPSVVVLPVPYPYATRQVAASAVEKSLPDAVAALVEWLVTKSGWTVAERPRVEPTEAGFTPAKARGFKPGEGEQLVELEERHICMLFRRFVKYGDDQTRPYVEALEARGIPHLLVGGRSFHEREEIETMRAALAAIEWPDDELSVFATLRGALFAIGDEELLEYRYRFGHFHPFRIAKELDTSSVVSGFSRTDPSSAVSGLSRTVHEGAVTAPRRDENLSSLRPIADALTLLQSLHRERNRVPVATTISRLLEATRAHVGFVLRPEGEQALANVLHVAELARQYEAEGGLSFRGFIEELRSQADGGRASEAPILEEGSDGVRLMTVHKAKGLEFPVVILADITAKLRSGEAARHLDSDRRVCAVRLGGWSPRDLLLHAAEEEARDEAEGVRIAYVAATRARDLLVVPAVGDGPLEGWWIDPLHGAIYPPMDSRREQTPAPGCPAFKSKDSVLSRPNADPALPTTVCPGLHRIAAGSGGSVTSHAAPGTRHPAPERAPSTQRPSRSRVPSTESRVPSGHTVVWWDPRELILDAEPSLGVRRPELIVKDVAESVVDEGLKAYQAWRARREGAIEQGSRPSLVLRTVREYAAQQVGGSVRLQVDGSVRLQPDQSAVEQGLSPVSPAPSAQRPSPSRGGPSAFARSSGGPPKPWRRRSGPPTAAQAGASGPPAPARPDPSEVAFVELPRAHRRPWGPRFGTLVHAALATVPLDADAERIKEVVVLQARVLGAGDEEVAAAAEIVKTVLAHDLLARARAAAARHACRRETPVMMKDADGMLVEGVVDLAFEEDGGWTVVDFKTDQELNGRGGPSAFARSSGGPPKPWRRQSGPPRADLDLYRRQVALYAEMVRAATGRPARPVLMRI